MNRVQQITYYHNQGAALAVSLVMLIVLALLGTAGIRTSMLEEKMSANMRDTEVSFHSAETALREGENWIIALSEEPIPATSCSSQPCVITYDPTLYMQDQNSTWWTANAASTSATMTGALEPGRYVIQYLRFVSDSSMQIGQGVPQGKHYYRVTVRATGTSPQAVTVLQSTVARRY